MTDDFDQTRRDLIALRVKYGADEAIGHRCSNLIEMLQSYGAAMPERQAAIGKLISKQMAELAHLTSNQ